MSESEVVKPQTGRGDWIYYALAASCFTTISLGLYLNFEVMCIVRGSVEVNQLWASRLATVWELSSLSSDVNAPGNDVFETRDTQTARTEMLAASAAMHRRIEAFEAEIAGVGAEAVRTDLLVLTGSVLRALDTMETNAHAVFDAIDAGDSNGASANMAAMDRKLAGLLGELSRIATIMRAEQRLSLDGQLTGADRLGQLEYGFSALAVALISFVLWYGRKMSKDRCAHESERERNT